MASLEQTHFYKSFDVEQTKTLLFDLFGYGGGGGKASNGAASHNWDQEKLFTMTNSHNDASSLFSRHEVHHKTRKLFRRCLHRPQSLLVSTHCTTS